MNAEITQSGFSIDESFDGADSYIRFTPTVRHRANHFVVGDLIDIFNNYIPPVLENRPMLKCNVTYDIDSYAASDPDDIKQISLRGSPLILTRGSDLEDAAKDIFEAISNNYEAFTSTKSGLVFKKINYIELALHDFTPYSGSGSKINNTTYKPLPDFIAVKKACINVKNNDERCLLYALLSAKFPADKNSDRVTKYQPYLDKINYNGVKFPATINDVKMIEKLNPDLFPCGINVFSYDEKNIFPIRISPRAKHDIDNIAVNLLLFDNHYVWIKNLSALIANGKDKIYYCYSCLSTFIDVDRFIIHNKYCFETRAVNVPEASKAKISFKKFARTKKLPFIFIADFEAFSNHTVSTNPTQLAFQTAASYCVNQVCINDKYSLLSPCYRVNSYNDVPANVALLKYLFECVDEISKLLDYREKDFVDLNSFTTSKQCYICKKKYGDGELLKVPFYDVVANKYIGAVHKSCRKFQEFYPVIFHNLRGYDGHLVLTALGHTEIAKYITDNGLTISCIPNNTERMMSITVGKLRFIDSMQFMAASLESLVNNLKDFPSVKKHFNDETVYKCLTSKGVFPYEWLDSPDKFSETSLPSIDKFYSQLRGCGISNSEYNTAVSAWDKLNCSTMGDYHDWYLRSDVLLLTDVFENFRTTSMKHYQLDPAHYYSAPGLSWDALLKLSKIELELFTDINMYLFVEQAIRGGICVITKKHARANNKYLHDYDATKPSNFIVYLDMNNLYGGAMTAEMPYGGFKWITEEEFRRRWCICASDEIITSLRLDNNVGAFVEFDADYPEHLHDTHNDYPFLAEKIIVDKNLLSENQRSLAVSNSKFRKLIPSVTDKKNYVCHVNMLSRAIDAGLIVTKIHRVLSFNQRPWMKSYIDGNTARRTAATTDFEKDFFKLMNNSVFGKTMENIRNRSSIEIVVDEQRRDKLVSSNTFVRAKKISDTLTLITKTQSSLMLDKPIYVGASVLDVSKTMMYDFHYGFTNVKWPNAKLLFTDTDSLAYDVPGEDCNDDIYESIYSNKELFDLSDVDKKGPTGKYHDVTNKKVIGKMKDEFAFKPIREFVGLRSKMYAVLTDENRESKKAKGISRSIVKNKLCFANYLEALARTPGTPLSKVTTMNLRSNCHTIYLTEITKTGLCNFDDKRYCEDGINTLAFGHYKIPTI